MEELRMMYAVKQYSVRVAVSCSVRTCDLLYNTFLISNPKWLASAVLWVVVGTQVQAISAVIYTSKLSGYWNKRWSPAGRLTVSRTTLCCSWRTASVGYLDPTCWAGLVTTTCCHYHNLIMGRSPALQSQCTTACQVVCQHVMDWAQFIFFKEE